MLETQKETARAYFNNAAEDYHSACTEKEPDSLRSYIFSTRKKIVLSMFDLRDCLVLDIGCGPGVLTEELLNRGCKVWGIDFSGKMIDMAGKKISEKGFKDKCHFAIGDIENLDFPDAYFDFVFCVGVLEYLKEDSLALKEIRRVLKPSGKVIFTVPNMASPLVLADKIALIMAKLSLSIINKIFGIAGIRFVQPQTRLSFRSDITDKYYFPRQLNNKLKKKGFIIDKTAFHAFRCAMLNSIYPKLALFLAKKSEFLSATPLRWMGIDYIVKASRE